MKLKKMFFVAAFLMAITASFAFKAEKKFDMNCTWITVSTPADCEELGDTDSNCSQYNKGSECTTYDPGSQTQVQAYVENGLAVYDCTFPLYHPH